MAFIINTGKTIRNHWKKSIVFSAVGVYAVRWLKGKYEDDLIIREYCQEAQKYGDVLIGPLHTPRKITVFLNPAAHNGTARKIFERHSAPLLYLAGLQVTVIKTEYEGQAKEYLSVMEPDDADGIVVAGGDGSLLEVVTGAMRKTEKKFKRDMPIGIIPLGKTNRFAQLMFGTDLRQVRFIANSTMSVIKGLTKRVDVMEIKADDGRSTYAMSGMEVGSYRDAHTKKQKYWYFGPFKNRWAYMRRTFGEWPQPWNFQYGYLPIDVEPQLKTIQVEQTPEKSRSWFSMFYKAPATKPVVLSSDDENVEISEEDLVYEDATAMEFNVMSSNFADSQQMKSLCTSIGPSEIARTDFIKEGWRRLKENSLSVDSELNRTLMTKVIKFIPIVTEDSWFSIDGEPFESMPVTIRLLPNRLNFYCCSDR